MGVAVGTAVGKAVGKAVGNGVGAWFGYFHGYCCGYCWVYSQAVAAVGVDELHVCAGLDPADLDVFPGGERRHLHRRRSPAERRARG